MPWLDDTMCGPLEWTHHRQLVSVLGMVRIEAFLAGWHGLPGRPPCERAGLAGAFIAKASVIQHSDHQPVDRDAVRRQDRCAACMRGWQRAGEVPSESTFSRAFAEFAASALPSRLHEALIQDTHSGSFGRTYLT